MAVSVHPQLDPRPVEWRPHEPCREHSTLAYRAQVAALIESGDVVVYDTTGRAYSPAELDIGALTIAITE
jgi:hypothetical protein